MSDDLRYRIGESSYVELVLGDITRQSTDAIVNAANSSLLGGGGVDGAIHRAAGPSMLEQCKKIRMQRGSLPAGKAVSTSGGLLPAMFVVHTVGPVWQGGKYNEPQILESCYCHSLEEAERLRCSSISFPSISTGAYRYPVAAAAQIALRTIVELLHQPNRMVKVVRFVLFEQQTFDHYATAMRTMGVNFPHSQIQEEPLGL
ncbi:MAG TPA: O-acetyl-ADP-ribose deacetylase [Candidatus Saccharimonadales bacterium]|jgi:O-acetyl-ADP-ribose deacetylase (regulator of RNase III)|nr:O-acetyl-ADP-ribose deacetylase [Candidatus Saccharimonadales bacterium]